jgi:hypothetical protein
MRIVANARDTRAATGARRTSGAERVALDVLGQQREGPTQVLRLGLGQRKPQLPLGRTLEQSFSVGIRLTTRQGCGRQGLA